MRIADERMLTLESSDGSGSGTLLTVDRGASLGVIGFSPHGDRILFAREGELWSIGVDGADERLVVAGTSQGDWLSP